MREVAKKEFSPLNFMGHEDYINKGEFGLEIPKKINGANIWMVPIYIIVGYVFIPWRFADGMVSRLKKCQFTEATKDFVLYFAMSMLVGLGWPFHIVGKIKIKN